MHWSTENLKLDFNSVKEGYNTNINKCQNFEKFSNFKILNFLNKYFCIKISHLCPSPCMSARWSKSL